MQLTDEERQLIERRRRSAALQAHKFNASGTLRDGERLQIPIMFADSAGVGTMTIQDAMKAVPGLSAKAHYAAAYMADTSRTKVESGITNAEGMIFQMRQALDGRFSSLTADTDRAGVQHAADFLEGLVAAARHRIRTGEVA